MKVRAASSSSPRGSSHRQLGTQREERRVGGRRDFQPATGGRRPASGRRQSRMHQRGRPREVAHTSKSPRAEELCLDGAGPGRGGASGLVPLRSSAPPAPAARPAGVRPERASELGLSLGGSDSAMASLPPLLCLCVAAAHLVGARGEAPPGPNPAP